MGSQTQSDRGQSVVEATLVIPLILIFLVSGTAYVLSIKDKFKHDYLSKSEVSDSAPPEAPDLQLTKNLISLPGKSVEQRLNDLASDGWELKNKLKTAEGPLFLLTRGSQHLVFDGHFGVITCGTNCSKN